MLKNLQEHYLVPKHEIVPAEKVADVLQQFGATLEKFPQLSRMDPIIEEIGAKRGDLIKLTRESRTAGTTIYYRVVV
ncbi:MAG: DNA-directed RNA polymerase subunit H [Candidatus Diapherotrites archaeon]